VVSRLLKDAISRTAIPKQKADTPQIIISTRYSRDLHSRIGLDDTQRRRDRFVTFLLQGSIITGEACPAKVVGGVVGSPSPAAGVICDT
jgi:hypothetical protein